MPGNAILLLTLVVLATGLPPPPASLQSLAWMAGSWETTRGGASIEERWTRPSSDTLIGMSRSVAHGRSRSFEFMRIESRSDGRRSGLNDHRPDRRRGRRQAVRRGDYVYRAATTAACP